jgi:hypothetical protein
LVLAAAATLACGPDVTETRMGFYPPRDRRCPLEFVSADLRTMGPASPWELIGYVTVSEKNPENPFSPKYREIVRPRACDMGGEAITIVQAGSRDSRFRSRGGTTFGVIRFRRPPGAQPPSPF